MVACSDLRISVRDEGVTVCVDGEEYQAPVPPAAALNELAGFAADLSPVEYGTKLFETVFVDPLMHGYRAALENTQLICRVRLEIDASEPALESIHWESLTAKGPPPRHLGHSYRTPFSRTLPSAEPVGVPAFGDQRKIKVLVVVASPADLEESEWQLPRLDEQAALDAIQASFDSVRDRYDVELLNAPASIAHIEQRLGEGTFHVLHLFAHDATAEDDDATHVILEDEHGAAAAVTDAQLAKLAGDAPALRLVVLAGSGGVEVDGAHAPARQASHGLVKLGRAILERGIPAVVAMRGRLDDEAGRLFVSTFYTDLVRSKTGMVDQAINQARQKIFYKRRETWAWTAPVLFLRGNGVLFAPAAETKPAQPASTPQQTPVPRVEATPRPSAMPRVLAGGKWVRDAKRIEPAKDLSRDLRSDAPKKVQLFDALSDLEANHEVVASLYWQIGLKHEANTNDTLDAEYRQLIDTAFDRGAAEQLQERIERAKHGREKASPAAQVLDLGALRLAKELRH